MVRTHELDGEHLFSDVVVASGNDEDDGSFGFGWEHDPVHDQCRLVDLAKHISPCNVIPNLIHKVREGGEHEEEKKKKGNKKARLP